MIRPAMPCQLPRKSFQTWLAFHVLRAALSGKARPHVQTAAAASRMQAVWKSQPKEAERWPADQPGRPPATSAQASSTRPMAPSTCSQAPPLGVAHARPRRPSRSATAAAATITQAG